jgi:DNA primase
MFVRNCIATTGVTKSKQLLASLVTKENSRIFFDNDKAGKEASLDLLSKGYSVFLWSLLISDLRKKHPNLIKEINTKIKDVNDLFRFMLNQQPELTFDEFNSFLDKYFSDSAFDLLLV